MPVGAIAGAAAPIVGGLVGKMFGGGGPKNAQAATPKDLQPMRQSNIGLLNYLLGFNQPGMPWSQPQQQMPQQHPAGGGMPPGMPGGNGWGAMPGARASAQPYTPGNMAGSGSQGMAGGLQQAAGGAMGMHPSFAQAGQPTSMGGMGGQLAGLMGGGQGQPGSRFDGSYAQQALQGGAFGGAGGGSLGGALGGMLAGGQGSPFHGGGMNLGGGMGGHPALSGGPNVGAGMPQMDPGMSGGPMGGGLNNRAAVDAMYPGQANMQLHLLGGYGAQPGGGFSSQLGQPGSDPNSALGRMESYFGPLGTPTTALQQQSLGGVSQFLDSNPYGQSNAALQNIMGSQGHNYFGGAQNAFKGVQNANYFGKASKQAGQVAGSNYFGDAKKSFQQLGNYNPFQPAQGALEGMFKQNPGQGVVDASMPMYQRELAAANQQGGRFGSANAILRSHALDDANLRQQQALQEGVNQQINAAGQYGQMGNSLIGAHEASGQGLLGVGQGQLQQGLGAGNLMLGVGQGQLQQGLGAAQGLLGVGQGRSSYGLGLMGQQINAAGQLANNQNSMFNNLSGAYGMGSQQATQEAQRQQQAMQILSGLMGTSQTASLGGPTVVSPTGAQQGAQYGSAIGQILASLGGGGGGGGSPMPFNNPGAAAPSFGIPYGLG